MPDPKGTSKNKKGTSAYEKGLPVSMSPENISSHLQYFISHTNKNFQPGVLLANNDSPPDLWIKPMGSAYWRLNTEISTNKSAAIRDMVDKTNWRKYQYDCTNFAYFASLYVLLEITNDDNKFNLMIEDSAMSFYQRDQTTKFFPIGYYNHTNKVPVGSRIYIQLVGELKKVGEGKEPFINMIPDYLLAEYCLKITDDKYYAHGLTKGFEKWRDLLYLYLDELLYHLQGQEDYPRKFVEFGDGTDSPSDKASRMMYLHDHHLKFEVRIIKFP